MKHLSAETRLLQRRPQGSSVQVAVNFQAEPISKSPSNKDKQQQQQQLLGTTAAAAAGRATVTVIILTK